MSPTNFDRMVELAEEYFGAKSDPEQLAVNQDIIIRLKDLHPMAVTERSTENGPVAWILVIPTTRLLMRQFVSGSAGERQLFEKTIPGGKFECLYLCSALVLPEFRGKGLALAATMEAVTGIRRDHPLTSLCVWEFSPEGRRLAETVARMSCLPMYIRTVSSHRH